jgi:hypothetical protein
VNTGQSATFSVEVIGTTAPTYQWKKNDVIIPGATNASYTIASAQQSDAGVYSVTITDGANSTSTAGATLTVGSSAATAPLVTSHPAAQSGSLGGAVSFTVAANGSPSPSYLWRKNGTPLSNGATSTGSTIGGASTATLTISNLSAADAGSYSVTATNSAGSVTSNAAALTVSTAVASSRIINLSVLTAIASPGDSFKMGYVVGGTSATNLKPLIIRAAGPSLAALNVAGTLNDPKIELFALTTKTSENDNWGGSETLRLQMAAVGAFPFTGPTSLDAATAVNINSRDNSVQVSANGNGTGVVIAEVYDATPAAQFTASTPR